MRKFRLIAILLLFIASVAGAQSLPNPLGWMIAGTPVASHAYLFTPTSSITFLPNLAGSMSRCGAPPSSPQTYTIWDYPSGGTNTQIGTVTLGTNCNATAGVTFTTTGGTAVTVGAGDALTLVAPASILGESDVGITLGSAAQGVGAVAPTLTMSPGDGVTGLDASTGGAILTTGFNASPSTLIEAPAITTTVPNMVVISVIGGNGSVVPTFPSGPTVLVPGTQPPLTTYNFWMAWQTVPTAGTLAARTGTQDLVQSGDTTGMSIALQTSGTPGFTVATASPADHVTASQTITFTFGTTPADGDLLLACGVTYNVNFNPSTGTIPSWTELPNTQRVDNHQSLICRYHVAHSESGAVYNITSGSGSGGVADLLDIKNVVLAGTTVTSPSGGFAKAKAGQEFCLVGGLDGTKQACGTISSVLSSTAIIPSFTPQPGLSGKAFLYCTNQDSAWINGAANFTGGSIGASGISCAHGPIVFRAGVPINLEGQATCAFIGDPTHTCTALVDTSLSGSAPFIQIGSGSTESAPTITGMFKISDMLIAGGIGGAMDGGGSGVAGINITNVHQITFARARFQNWAGDGGQIFAAGSAPVSDTSIANFIMDQAMFQGNGGAGLHLKCSNTGGPAGGTVIQNLNWRNNEFTQNHNEGVLWENCNDVTLSAEPNWTFHAETDIFQGNWHNNSGGCTSGSPCYQFRISSTRFAGAVLDSEYFENDELGVVNPANQDTGWTGAHVQNWMFASGPSGAPRNTFYPIFNSTSNPLDNCGALIDHTSACVSDATACNSGSTYAGGSGTPCIVQCIGGVWKETGAGCF